MPSQDKSIQPIPKESTLAAHCFDADGLSGEETLRRLLVAGDQRSDSFAGRRFN
jgi:hypothetical protein